MICLEVSLLLEMCRWIALTANRLTWPFFGDPIVCSESSGEQCLVMIRREGSLFLKGKIAFLKLSLSEYSKCYIISLVHDAAQASCTHRPVKDGAKLSLLLTRACVHSSWAPQETAVAGWTNTSLWPWRACLHCWNSLNIYLPLLIIVWNSTALMVLMERLCGPVWRDCKIKARRIG